MKVFGIAGYSGSGKTTLLVRLLPLIIARGLSVSTLKHAHHTFEIDQPGKDSHSHRQAGATEVMIASAQRWALIHDIAPGGGYILSSGNSFPSYAKVENVLAMGEGLRKYGHYPIDIKE